MIISKEKRYVLLLSPVDICCVINIILVQRLSKQYSIACCIYILCRDIVTGKNQGGTRNLSACRKKGEESDNQQGGKVRSTIVVLG